MPIPSFKNLKRYVALKIKVNFETGERAGGIDPTDPGLYCLAQNIEDGWEIRLVLDDRDISVYQGVEGIEIIEGIEGIDRAIIELLPNDEQWHFVRDDLLVQASIIAKHQDPNDPFSIDKIPDDRSVVELREDGVYIDGKKVLGPRASLRLARKVGRTVPAKVVMLMLPPEVRHRLLHIWLIRHGVKGIRMIRRVRKLSELLR